METNNNNNPNIFVRKKSTKRTIINSVLLLLVIKAGNLQAQFDGSLLSGNTSKVWNITDNFPKDSIEACNFPNDYSFDNLWTFNSDNSFSFNPGNITISTSYPGCKDGTKISGKWEIEGADTLKLYVVYANNDLVYIDIKYKILELTNIQFKITSVDSENNNQVLVFTRLN